MPACRGSSACAIWAALAIAALAPVALIAFVTTGHRPATVATDTMEPALRDGDLIVNHVVPASAVEVGDVVTYSDALRPGGVVTERVLEVRPAGDHLEFTTMADSGDHIEQWSLASEETVGLVSLRVPFLGRLLSIISVPVLSLAVLVALGGVLSLGAGRRAHLSRAVLR